MTFFFIEREYTYTVLFQLKLVHLFFCSQQAAVCMPSALPVSCLSSSTTCCSQLTNCHGTVPSTPVTDVSAGWLLMKIGWKTSIGLSPGGVPWFIMPAFVPEATGSTLSARTDPCKFEGLVMQWAEGSLFKWLVCYWHVLYSVEQYYLLIS